MSIELAKKHFVELKKKASEAVALKGLNGQKAKVALALDISGSMSGLFSNGTVQEVVEKMLALAVKFDDNAAIDIFLFNSQGYEVGELQEADFYNYVNTRILSHHSITGGTNYAPVMRKIIDKYLPDVTTNLEVKESSFIGKLFGRNRKVETVSKSDGIDDPVFVLFITDGDNSDKEATEELIIESSNYGVFWQFVGIGGSSFSFLEKLNHLKGRKLDNADFFVAKDIKNIDDEKLYDKLLNEFPQWIKDAKKQNLVKEVSKC